MNDIINFFKTRRSTTVKTMIAGHLKESDLNDILACGIRVPDHGALNPWSLTVIKDNARSRIGKEVLVPEFILINPEMGWICLEVKGGAISRNEKGWRQSEKDIDDPIEKMQKARSLMYELLEKKGRYFALLKQSKEK